MLSVSIYLSPFGFKKSGCSLAAFLQPGKSWLECLDGMEAAGVISWGASPVRAHQMSWFWEEIPHLQLSHLLPQHLTCQCYSPVWMLLKTHELVSSWRYKKRNTCTFLGVVQIKEDGKETARLQLLSFGCCFLQCCRDARGCNSIEHPQYPNPSWKMVLRHLSSSGIAVHVSRY